MRLFSHQINGNSHIGAVRGQDHVDLGQGDLKQVLTEGKLNELAQRIESASVIADPAAIQFLPPVQRPGKIICVGLNYSEHRDEAGASKKADYPDFFIRVHNSFTAHNLPIIRPQASADFDFEGELALVIGKTSRHLNASNALEAIAGYSVVNEGSIRDYQFRASQWTWGKNFDSTGSIGPYMVTEDELPRSVKEGLQLETRLNGETVQSASTSQLIFDLPTLLSMITEGMTLEPGDVIVTGTPSGVGLARTPKLYMKEGDVVEVEIEGVGLLRNAVKDEIPA